jgi:hypothetical protein
VDQSLNDNGAAALPNGAPTPDFAPWTGLLRASYDRVAEAYAARIDDELRCEPLDRELLDRLAARVGALGPICD